MSISRRDLFSLPLVGVMSAEPALAEGAAAEALDDKKKPAPKTVEELLAAYADLLDQLAVLKQHCSHLSRANPPVGTVVAFAGKWRPRRGKGPEWTEAELGWLLCDGRKWDVVQQSLQKDLDELGMKASAGQLLLELRAVLDTDSLPDYQGYFLRGLDTTGKRDKGDLTKSGQQPRKNVGSVQTDSTKRPNQPFITDDPGNHVHLAPTWNGKAGNYEVPQNKYGYDFESAAPTEPKGAHTHKVTGGGDSETRPINIAVHWIIKFK
jgi:hypothetical protein